MQYARRHGSHADMAWLKDAHVNPARQKEKPAARGLRRASVGELTAVGKRSRNLQIFCFDQAATRDLAAMNSD